MEKLKGKLVHDVTERFRSERLLSEPSEERVRSVIRELSDKLDSMHYTKLACSLLYQSVAYRSGNWSRENNKLNQGKHSQAKYQQETACLEQYQGS